jgi:Fur family ferric uptake transcriptional regulator
MTALTMKDAERRLTAHLKSKGLKVTRQRELILESFLKTGKHIGVEELLLQVRRRSPTIGNATVYRTMKLFVEAGIAEERRFSTGATLYEAHDGDEHHHDHLICTSCERIFEFENEEIEKLQDEVAESHGFRLTHHKMELYGVCRDCQR